jgi:subtilase family serine protease
VKLSRRSVSTWLTLAAPVVFACSPPEPQPGIVRAKNVYDDLGPSDGNAIVRAVVGLRVRDRAGLDALAHELYEPASPSFHRFLSPSDVASRFLPTDDDVSSLRRWATAHGLTVSFVASNHLLVEIDGPAQAYDDAFTTTVHAYMHRTRSQRVYGTPSGIHVPNESGIDALLSLDEPARIAEGDDDEPESTDAGSTEPTLGIGFFRAKIARSYDAETL